MAFNIFKKKEETKEAPAVKEAAPKAEKPAASAPKAKGKGKVSLPGVLLNPHVTEKASLLAEKGQYVFRVHPLATKGAVKQSVEALYGVEVRDVRMTKKPAKKVRLGRKEGVKQGMKKAVVQVKRGQTIEVISR
ncbi:MAG: 50S ribosomal protein L23 [bacterium]|nr:50S ribosomal protein L23 [bacterium]